MSVWMKWTKPHQVSITDDSVGIEVFDFSIVVIFVSLKSGPYWSVKQLQISVQFVLSMSLSY